MTRAEIISAVRNLVNEQSTDSGALLSDTGNLLEYINDAVETVALDLMEYCPEQFLGTENVTLVADQANYTLTASWYMIYKIEKNISDLSPKEIEIIDPLEKQFYTNVGETTQYPKYCYLQGETLYFVKTPSSAVTDYAKVYYIKPGVSSMAVSGPSVIPTIAHRLIVYAAAVLVATMLEMKTTNFEKLYARKFARVSKTLASREQQRPRFVRDKVKDRSVIDAREKVFYDHRWLD